MQQKNDRAKDTWWKYFDRSFMKNVRSRWVKSEPPAGGVGGLSLLDDRETAFPWVWAIQKQEIMNYIHQTFGN